MSERNVSASEVTINTVSIGPKQVTLSLFRQLPRKNLVAVGTGLLARRAMGTRQLLMGWVRRSEAASRSRCLVERRPVVSRLRNAVLGPP